MTRPLKSHQIFFAALLCITAVFSAAQSAYASQVSITDGDVSWGIRQSYRNYIVNGAASGSITTIDGAQICNATTCDADGVITYDPLHVPVTSPTRDVDGGLVGDFFKLPIVSGTIDEETDELELTLGGTIKFYGHYGALDMTFSNIRLSLKRGVSSVVVDSHSKDMDTGQFVDESDVRLVELDLSGVSPVVDETSTSWTDIPSKVTAAGAAVFGADNYPVGTSFDPVSIDYLGPGGVPHDPPTPTNVVVETEPLAQTVTLGSRNDSGEAHFVAEASGDPEPTVQWQRSADGDTWSDIEDATEEELTLTVGVADSGTKFRAVFTNSTGFKNSAAVALTVDVVDVIAPVLTVTAPSDGSVTTADSTTLDYTVTDNDTPSPACTITNGATLPLKLGVNNFTLVCQDDAHNLAIKTFKVTRVEPAPVVPDPAAPIVKNGGTTTLKYKKGRSAKVTLGTLTCGSESTCVYTFTKSIRIKVGKKKYTLKVKGPATLEPGQSAKLTTTIPANTVKAIKRARKKVKLVVKVEVANTLKTRHETAKNSISNVR